MDSSRVVFPPFHPALLPLHTVVGHWRLEARLGCGSFGAVYRALPLHGAHASSVALKLALRPKDPRFVREAHLLSSFHHPSIPQLLEQGCWQSPAGTEHPFLVMPWIDGVSFYEQARNHPCEPFHVRHWVMQLAQALAVLHAEGVVHRDLKGDNILVRRSDSRALLMDFGTGLYPGAAPLTPPLGFPGTSLYRSPESWFFEVCWHNDPTALYRPTPADDLFALGVTLCRLLTGAYPEFDAPTRDEQNTLHQGGVQLPRALMRSPYVDPELRMLALKLMSLQPEQRGTAAELAKELEWSLRPSRPNLPKPVAKASEPSTSDSYGGRVRALAAVALVLGVFGVCWAIAGGPGLEPERAVARAEPAPVDSADAGTSGLGEAAASMTAEEATPVSPEEGLNADTLPEPVPGQVRPDEKGRCPIKGPVALNGGCWWQTTEAPEKCEELEGQMFKGTCYIPFVLPGRKRPPTSDSLKTP